MAYFQYQTFFQDIRARGFSPKFVLDVGANQGNWTRMAKIVFPQAGFLLIDPQAEMKNSLDDICSNFEVVTWIEAGAGSREGKLVQTEISDDLRGSSFLQVLMKTCYAQA